MPSRSSTESSSQLEAERDASLPSWSARRVELGDARLVERRAARSAARASGDARPRRLVPGVARPGRRPGARRRRTARRSERLAGAASSSPSRQPDHAGDRRRRRRRPRRPCPPQRSASLRVIVVSAISLLTCCGGSRSTGSPATSVANSKGRTNVGSRSGTATISSPVLVVRARDAVLHVEGVA